MSAAPKLKIAPLPSRRNAVTLRKDVRLSLMDGATFALMVGLGETYIPAFVIAIGLGEVNSGLITTLPLLVGALIQLAAPMIISYFRSYRRWAVLCASLQALAFVPLMIGALVGFLPASAVFMVAALYWGTSMSLSAAWNSWIGATTPACIRKGFCAKRNRWNQLLAMVGFLAGGWLLKGSGESKKLWPFAIAFGVSFLARAVSARLMAHQTDFTPSKAHTKPLALSDLTAVFKNHPDVFRLLCYFLCVQFAVYTSNPYFTPYLLKHIKFSYPQYAILTAAAYGARVCIYPWLARCGREHGTHSLLWTGGIGICLIPALWIVCANFWYILAIQILAGCVWAAFELATILMIFETIGNEVRITALTFYNVANAVVISIASLVGATLLDAMPGKTSTYFILFGLSCAGRLATVFVLRTIVRDSRKFIPLSPLPVAVSFFNGFAYPFQRMRVWRKKGPPSKAGKKAA